MPDNDNHQWKLDAKQRRAMFATHIAELSRPQTKRVLRFRVSELENELFEAVKVAYERGAHEWVRIRHPKLYVIIKETE